MPQGWQQRLAKQAVVCQIDGRGPMQWPSIRDHTLLQQQQQQPHRSQLAGIGACGTAGPGAALTATAAAIAAVIGTACAASTNPGEGMLQLVDVVRVRIACSSLVDKSVVTLRATPRPSRWPGQQQVSIIDYDYRGRLYPGSVRVDDVVLFVSPGDVEDAAYYAGESAQMCDM